MAKLLSERFEQQLIDGLRWIRRADRTFAELRRILKLKEASRFPDRAVVLDEDLPRADHSFAPTSARATLLRWDIDRKQYREFPTDPGDPNKYKVTVYNHSEHADYAADTFGLISPADGHWWFQGDCGPMADREPPT